MYRSLNQTLHHVESRIEELRTLDGVRDGADERDPVEKIANRIKEVCGW